MSEPTGARRYGVGGGDAYYDAVKYGGYEGTREQFGRDQAEFAQNAAAVAEAKETVERDTEEVRNTKNTFENTTVPEAIQALEQESEDQILAITQKGEEVSQQVETVGTEQKDAVANEGRARVQAVKDEGDTQVQRVTDAGDAQVGRVEEVIDPYIQQAERAQAAAEDAQRKSEVAQGKSETAASNAEQSAQHAQDLVDTLPDDYTDMLEDVSGLNETKDIRTVSGDIVSFDSSYADMPLNKLTVNIKPVQAGTGDPSPDNVRPITGWTGAKVTRTGKNMANQLAVLASTRASWDSELEAIKFTNLIDRREANSTICTINKPGQITVSYDIRHDGNDSGDREIVVIVYTDKTLSQNVSRISQAGTWRHVTITSDPDKIVERVSYSSYYGTAGLPAYLKNIQVEVGTQETDYEPYQGNTYDITFPSEAGTVYSGELTVNPDRTGTLVVDRASADLGSLSWQWINVNGVQRICSDKLPNIKTPSTDYYAPNAICSVYKLVMVASIASQDGTATIGYSGYGYGERLIINDSRITAPDQAQSVLTDQTLVYKLKNPNSYTLTTAEISGILKTLYGQNNIWADTGDIEVQYGAYISTVKNELGEKVPKLMIAPMEKTTTASKPYAVNEFLIMGDKLYIVTANIASGGTITIGTNVSETTIGAQITALLNA